MNNNYRIISGKKLWPISWWIWIKLHSSTGLKKKIEMNLEMADVGNTETDGLKPGALYSVKLHWNWYFLHASTTVLIWVCKFEVFFWPLPFLPITLFVTFKHETNHLEVSSPVIPNIFLTKLAKNIFIHFLVSGDLWQVSWRR